MFGARLGLLWLRNNLDIFMLHVPYGLLWTLLSIIHTVAHRLKEPPLSVTMLVTTVEKKRVLESLALAIQFFSLEVTYTTYIYNRSARTSRLPPLSYEGTICPKDREPETFGNSTSNYHKSQSCNYINWGKGMSVEKSQAYTILQVPEKEIEVQR